MKTIDIKTSSFIKIEFTIHLPLQNYYRKDFQIETKKKQEQNKYKNCNMEYE